MADNAVAADQDPLRDLLEKQGIRRVAIVDDAFDPIEVRDLTTLEKQTLWATIEFNDQTRNEIAQLELEANGSDDITGGLVAKLLESRSKCPAFGALWDASDAAQNIAGGLSGVEPWAKHLREDLNLEVQKFGAAAETEKLTDFDPQLLFLDWHLGDDASPLAEEAITCSEIPAAVHVATGKVKEILQIWPVERPKPLIILMSSRDGMQQDASDFCRRSEVLQGMFYAVPKKKLGDFFSLRMHLHLFAMSLPEGRRIQKFFDTLRAKFEDVSSQLFEDISDLTLTDFSYIQSLSLQKDGQPLGDYLLWLFSTYFGQLLFAEALRVEGADLDAISFDEVLPSPGPPSDRLTKVYHSALFDTAVGPIRSHPLAVQTYPPASHDLSVLALGDILKRESPKECATHNKEVTEQDQPLVDGAKIVQESDLLLVINAQCDLAVRPGSSHRPSDAEQSILLLPGYLKPLDSDLKKFIAFTELYQHDGVSFRIKWDTKKVLTIPHGQFAEWKDQMNCERVARLRLPYALEIQRSFAAELTRVGTPVTPPILQPVAARLLLASDNAYNSASALQDGEAVTLVQTKTGQQCVLTIPLLMRLKGLLDEELDAMRAPCTQIQSTGDDSVHLNKKIEALERAIDNESKWATLRSPFDLPTINSPKKFFDERIQIVRGKRQGDPCSSKIVVAVSLDLDEVVTQ